MVMKKVYTADSPAIAWHFRNVLDQHGIASLVKNDLLYSVGGEVPSNRIKKIILNQRGNPMLF